MRVTPGKVSINTSIAPMFTSNSYAFADAGMNRTNFHTGDWMNPIPLGPRGEIVIPPGKTARSSMFVGMREFVRDGQPAREPFDYPEGDYVVEFNADADVDFNYLFSGTGGRFVLPVKRHPEGVGLVLECTRSNPEHPLIDSSVRIWSPGCERSKSTFRSEYVDTLRGYHSARFMQDQNITRKDGATAWPDRATRERGRYSNNLDFVPIEDLCELANESGCNPWFCFHYLSDVDYIRNMAETVKACLDDRLFARFESDNEVWNWPYPVAGWQQDKHPPAGTPGATGDDNFFGQTDWYPWRCQVGFRILEDVFSGKDRRRLRTVVASQSVWRDRSAWLLRKSSEFNGGGKPCDELAVAPYFYGTGGTTGDYSILKDPNLTVDQCLDDVTASVMLWIPGEARANREVVAKYQGVGLVGYEVGQHLQANRGPGVSDEQFNFSADMYTVMNRHPRMASIYSNYYNNLLSNGFDEVFAYTQSTPYGRGGCWGLDESGAAIESRAPKLAGTKMYISGDVPSLESHEGGSTMPTTRDLIDGRAKIVDDLKKANADLETHQSQVVEDTKTVQDATKALADADMAISASVDTFKIDPTKKADGKYDLYVRDTSMAGYHIVSIDSIDV